MDIVSQIIGAMFAAMMGEWWAQKRRHDEYHRRVPDRDVWGWPWENSQWPSQNWRRRQ
jgi:hypothetical protein